MSGSMILIGMITAGALFVAGIAGLVAKSHLMKMVMGLEFCGKGVCLLFIAGGYASGQPGLSQAVVITIIAIEAVVAGVALALVILLKRSHGTLNSDRIFQEAGGE